MQKAIPGRLVLKLGTQVVVDQDAPAMARLQSIVAEAVELIREGGQVVLVSSGAVGMGRQALRLTGPLELADKQACAAVGQSRMMEVYTRLFHAHGITVAQVLVTAHDFTDRTRYLNLKSTFGKLLDYGVIPIVNENDVVSVAGIQMQGTSLSFDDNDKLSALVAGKLGADVLLILTVVGGVFDANPADHPEARLISTIDTFDQLRSVETAGQSLLGRGGMASKLAAARMATLCGVRTVIASGLVPHPVFSALRGHGGTSIRPQEGLSGRKRWIGVSSGYQGVLVLNQGARDVLQSEPRSLLAIGVTGIIGDFEVQDVVSIQDEHGIEIARGLAGMSSQTLRRVMGMHSSAVREALAPGEKDEVVHRDHLVVF